LFLQRRRITFREDSIQPQVEKGWFSEIFEYAEARCNEVMQQLAEWAQEWHEMPLVLRQPECCPRDAMGIKRIIWNFRYKFAQVSKQKLGFTEELEAKAQITEETYERVQSFLPEFAHMIHCVPLANGSISDAILFSGSFLRDYLRIIQRSKGINVIPLD